MAKKSSLFRFTQAELDRYIKDENSCVKCVPSKMHIGFPPYGLDNFKETLLGIISRRKIGTYDADSRGIVLDVRNIKLEGTMSHIRYDSPELHMNIMANFYVFQPHLGALLKGTVKHISKRHVSALIYNVFNVSIRLNGDFMRKLKVNKEISFRVKKFDLQNVLPYIEGELVDVSSSKDDETGADSGIGDGEKDQKEKQKKETKKVSFGGESSSSSSDDDSEDEKVFKSLVVKTESSKAAKSSSEESDSSSEDEVKETKPFVRPIKVEPDENDSSSSSDESSDDGEAPMPVKSVPKPLQIVKKEKNAGKSSDSDSSTAAINKKAAEVAEKFPPSQYHTTKAIKQEKKDSSSSSSEEETSSDEEQFKIPMPIVKQEGGQIVIKREVTPSRKKENSSSSSASEAEGGKKPESVKRKVLQSPVIKTPTKSTSSTDSEGVKKSTPQKKTKKSPTPVKKQKTPAKESSSSESDEEEPAFTLNTSIQNLAQQILAKKATKTTVATPKKRKSQGLESTPTAKKLKKSSKESEADVSGFGTDILSSTRLDSASPLAKPKKKKTASKEKV